MGRAHARCPLLIRTNPSIGPLHGSRLRANAAYGINVGPRGAALVRQPALRINNSDVAELESPAHEVTLTRPFYLADREVTVEQFLRFVADADCPAVEKPQLWEGISIECSPTPDCPVQMVNWFDAVLYCNWLSGRADV